MQKVLFILALLCAIFSVPVALAEEPADHKTEKLPYVAVEGGSGYKELYVAQPLTKRLSLHGLLFSVKSEEHRINEVIGFLGPAFRLLEHKGFEMSVGAGLYAGKHQPTAAGIFGELQYEAKFLKGEAVVIHSLGRPQEHGRRDTYFVWYFGPQFRCWSHAKCEVGFAQDDIGHDRERENLRGLRVAVPLGIPKVKGFVKILSHSTVLGGIEFRP